MAELLYSILAVSLIGAILALLLEIAHRFIANYPDSHIVINDQKDLVVPGGRSIFFSLMDQGIFIPSACGGRGTCSYCKVKVLEGGGPVLPTETPYLSPEELAGNVRLSCQVKVRNDVKIEIPEELFNIKEFKVRVSKMEKLTPVVRGVSLEILSPEEGITFKPGQYIQLEVPAFELSKTTDFRAFSVASPAYVHDRISLMITRAPDGPVSIYVHDYLKEGDELVMRGPFGDFYYRESDRDMVMIATGSGLAPIRSILYHLEKNEIQRKATLVFGARTRDDLIHLDDMKKYEKTLFNFTYVPILSNVPDGDPWDGERGYIPDYLKKFLPKDPPVDAFICGAPIVVELSEKTLMELGVPKEHIYYDKFA